MGFGFRTQPPTFTAVKTTSLNYNLGGGQFEPDKGGQFAPDLGGHFQPDRGGQFDRIFQSYAMIPSSIGKMLASKVSCDQANVGINKRASNSVLMFFCSLQLCGDKDQT